MLVVFPRLGIVSPPVVSGVASPGPVRGSPLGEDGTEDEALAHSNGSQRHTNCYRAQEDGFSQGLEDGQSEDGEEEDVLHS